MKKFIFLSLSFSFFVSACASNPETPPAVPVAAPVIQTPTVGPNYPAPPTEPVLDPVFGSWRLTSMVCDGEGDPILFANLVTRFTQGSGESVVWSIRQDEEGAIVYTHGEAHNLRRVVRSQSFQLSDNGHLIRTDTAENDQDVIYPGISMPRSLSIFHCFFPRHNPVEYTYRVTDQELTLTSAAANVCANTDENGVVIQGSAPRNQIITFEREF